MKLYEIDRMIEDAIELHVDTETGELLEGQELVDYINSLEMERSDKIEHTALWVKSMKAYAEDIAVEIRQLQARKKGSGKPHCIGGKLYQVCDRWQEIRDGARESQL